MGAGAIIGRERAVIPERFVPVSLKLSDQGTHNPLVYIYLGARCSGFVEAAVLKTVDHSSFVSFGLERSNTHDIGSRSS